MIYDAHVIKFCSALLYSNFERTKDLTNPVLLLNGTICLPITQPFDGTSSFLLIEILICKIFSSFVRIVRLITFDYCKVFSRLFDVILWFT